MIQYDGALPTGALVHVHRGATDPAPVWLTATPDSFVPMAELPGRISAWWTRTGEAKAVRVGPNAEGTRVDDDPPALVFAAGVNSGLVLSGTIPEAGAVTIAAILRTTALDGETLFTLMPTAGGDYVYAAQRGAEVRAEQDRGNLTLIQPIAPGAGQVLLVTLTIAGGQVGLSVNGGPATTAPLEGAGMAGPADLFIGCRGPRGGLHRKLGHFRLTDVLVWPDGQGDPRAAEALWQERTADVA